MNLRCIVARAPGGLLLGVFFSEFGRFRLPGLAAARRPIALCFAARISGLFLHVTGVDAMSRQRRSFYLAVLLPAFLLGSVSAVVQAAQPAKAARWSDRGTWPNKK